MTARLPGSRVGFGRQILSFLQGTATQSIHVAKHDEVCIFVQARKHICGCRRRFRGFPEPAFYGLQGSIWCQSELPDKLRPCSLYKTHIQTESDKSIAPDRK